MGNNGSTRSLSSNRELALLTFVIVAAVGLRIALPGRMAVEHFDEGVYASNLAAGPWREFRYPQRHLYAPPLLPACVEWSQSLFGRGSLGTMLPNLLAGSLTVLLLWWVAREWFGPGAGLAAAAMAALSDFHILYSRTALTDPLMCFWLPAAVYLTWICLRKPSLWRALWAGLVTSLGWWTKYNGWLPLAIGLSGWLAWSIVQRTGWSDARRRLAGWCGIALVALCAWSPVLIDLGPRGGYSAVAENHRGYLVGLPAWPAALVRQHANLCFYDGWFSVLAPAVGLLIAGTLAASAAAARTQIDGKPGSGQIEPTAVGASLPAVPAPAPRESTNRRGHGTGGRHARLAAATLLVAGTSILGGSSTLLAVLAVAGIVVQLGNNSSDSRDAKQTRDRKLAAWMLAAWFVGLLVSTPLYREYPRLALPWLMSSWLGASALYGWVLDRWMETSTEERPRRPIPALYRLMAGLGLLAAAVAFQGNKISSRGVPGWQDRTGLQTIARQAVEAASRLVPADRSSSPAPVLYTYAEPALFFHLSGLSASTAPVGGLSFLSADEPLRTPTSPEPAAAEYLLTGPHAHHDPAFSHALGSHRGTLERVAAYPYRASDLVLLDRYSPRQLDRGRPHEEIRMYRIRRPK